MSTSGSQSGVVLELAEEFLQRYRKGERPSLKEYIDRHPHLAAEIKEVFPAMALMENIAIADESLASPPTGEEAPPPPAPLRQLGDFRILREVGRGGMGIVYAAEQVSLGRHVALKVLPQKMLLDTNTKRRFEREAKAAAKLHHTNIVPVFGVGEHDGMPYYAMQFIQGQGLDKVLDELRRLRSETAPRRDQPEAPTEAGSAVAMARSMLTGEFRGAPEGAESVPADTSVAPASAPSSLVLPGQSEAARKKTKPPTYWQSVARIGAQVADALDHAHKQGVLHRDIKPSNLLLDAQGTVWVTDFGLAKADDQPNLTHTGDILGTLRYMPPEAFEGKADRRGDVYSLGLTLYEMLTLRPAFEERDRLALVATITCDDPPRPRSLDPRIPRDLETIVLKAIDKDQKRRYPSAGELAADLQRFADDQPIQARRMGVPERCRRWCRRNPLVASLLAALVLVFLGGFVAVSWQWLRAEALREDAEEARADAVAGRDKAEEQQHRAEVAEGEAKEEADCAQRAEARALAEAERTRRLLYAADIRLAAQVWESEIGTAFAVRNLLKAHEKTGEEDQRDFAWLYQSYLLKAVIVNLANSDWAGS